VYAVMSGVTVRRCSCLQFADMRSAREPGGHQRGKLHPIRAEYDVRIGRRSPSFRICGGVHR
jgi:hypothetical protein